MLCGALAGCGAGIVTGAIFSNDNNGGRTPQLAPGIEPVQPLLPLHESLLGNNLRSCLVRNFEGGINTDVRVELHAFAGPGGAGSPVVAVQRNPLVLSREGGVLLIAYTLSTTTILNDAVSRGLPVEAVQYPGSLHVFIGGQEVAPGAPVTRVGRPGVTLIGPTPAVLDPDGDTDVKLQVTGLLAQSTDDFDMVVVTQDLVTGALVARSCTNLRFLSTPGEPVVSVSASVPGNPYMGEAFIGVEDEQAGSSSVLTVDYRPKIRGIVGSTGPTQGGENVTVFGRALAPIDAGTIPRAPQFSNLEVRVVKGGREVLLSPSAINQDDSTLDSVLLTMPASPDGRPGPSEVQFRLRNSPDVRDSGLFTYGFSETRFGPRGVRLDRTPLAIAALGPTVDQGSGDLLVLQDQAGLARIDRQLSGGNGMFVPLGAGPLLSNPGDEAERNPFVLAVANFDGVPPCDVLIAHRGIGAAASHLVLAGRSAPASPLTNVVARIRTNGQPRAVLTGDLDGDTVDDLVFLGAGLGAPEVFLARPTSVPGAEPAPGFIPGVQPQLPIGPWEIGMLRDLDGDGALDLALQRGGLDLALCVAYGRGDGTFAPGEVLAFSIPNYQPAPNSEVVGLHALGSLFPKPLAVVLAGDGSMATPATVAVLPRAGGANPTGYGPPALSDVTQFGTSRLLQSLMVDLDRDGVDEIVIAERGTLPVEPLRVLGWDSFGMQLLQNPSVPVEPLRTEGMAAITVQLPSSDPRAVPHVLAIHRANPDGASEIRVSSFPGTSSGGLAAAQEAAANPLPVHGLALGSFIGEAAGVAPLELDLVVATDAENTIQVFANQGRGVMRPVAGHAVPDMISGTMRTLPADAIANSSLDRMIVLTDNGRLSYVDAEAGVLGTSEDLRLLTGDPDLESRLISAASAIEVGDIDLDGRLDLLVLLRFQGAAANPSTAARLIIARGIDPVGSELPWRLPQLASEVATVHGLSSSAILGQFVESPNVPFLEIALAVPSSVPGGAVGDHVRFYRLVESPSEALVPQASSSARLDVLFAGSAPTALAAIDVDGTGTVDLIVASAGDSQIHTFLNDGSTVSGRELEVNLDAFQESLASPRPIPPGTPQTVCFTELDGNGVPDVVVAVRDGSDAQVVFFAGRGQGRFDGPNFLSSERTGRRVFDPITGTRPLRGASLAWQVGKLNGDEFTDIVFGWSTAGPEDLNLRLLFGSGR